MLLFSAQRARTTAGAASEEDWQIAWLKELLAKPGE